MNPKQSQHRGQRTRPVVLTMTQYCCSACRRTEVMSESSAVPRERKKLVWQSWWQVSSWLSVITRQQGIHGVGDAPCGITWSHAGRHRDTVHVRTGANGSWVWVLPRQNKGSAVSIAVAQLMMQGNVAEVVVRLCYDTQAHFPFSSICTWVAFHQRHLAIFPN